MKKLFFVLFTLAFAAFAVHAQADIHRVDFKNFTYSASCVGEKPMKIAVKDGESTTTKKPDDEDYADFSIFAIEYGDLNGDGQDEAVILSNCNTGGTGQFTEGFVYTMKAGKPTLLLRIPGGDRGDGGLVSAKVVGGLLVVEQNAIDGAGGSCCPQFIDTYKYSVVNAKLVQSGKIARREAVPRQRIAFDKGTSSKTFKVTIDPYTEKRFTVGAAAGQTLSVSVDLDGVTMSIPGGDLETVDRTRGFTAKIPKKGDYTFELENGNDKAREITVTVKIQ